MDGGDPTSPVSPLAPYPPLPPTEVRSRAAEFYGFVAWTSTYLLFCFFLLWALLPDEYIIWFGVSWYPSRYVVHDHHSCTTARSFPPTRCCDHVIVVIRAGNGPYCCQPTRSFSFFSPTSPTSRWHSPARHVSPTLVRSQVRRACRVWATGGSVSAHDSWECATDPKAHLPDPRCPSPYVAAADADAIPAMYDVPIGLVNRVMYSGQSARSRARTVPSGSMPTGARGPA